MAEAKLLQQKVIVVTGSCGGFGQAFVKKLYANGASIIAVDIQPESGNKLYGKGSQFHQEKLIYINGDITKAESWKEILESGIEKFGRIDILIVSLPFLFHPE